MTTPEKPNAKRGRGRPRGSRNKFAAGPVNPRTLWDETSPAQKRKIWNALRPADKVKFASLYDPPPKPVTDEQKVNVTLIMSGLEEVECPGCGRKFFPPSKTRPSAKPG